MSIALVLAAAAAPAAEAHDGHRMSEITVACVPAQAIVPPFNNTPEAMDQSRIAATMVMDERARAGDRACRSAAPAPSRRKFRDRGRGGGSDRPRLRTRNGRHRTFRRIAPADTSRAARRDHRRRSRGGRSSRRPPRPRSGNSRADACCRVRATTRARCVRAPLTRFTSCTAPRQRKRFG